MSRSEIAVALVMVSLVAAVGWFSPIPIAAEADTAEIASYQLTGAVTDTFTIASGDSIGRGIGIQRASHVGLYVPTLTSAAIRLQAASHADSTYRDIWEVNLATEAVFEIGAGTGEIALDVSELVTGFAYFRVWLGAAQGATRTFSYTVKY